MAPSHPPAEVSYVTSADVAASAQREGATVYENIHTNKFEAWSLDKIRACVVALRCRREMERSGSEGGGSCGGGIPAETIVEFERLHPNLAKMAKSEKPGVGKVLDKLIELHGEVRDGKLKRDDIFKHLLNTGVV